MRNIFFCFLVCLCVFSFPAYGEETSTVFTNKDLKQYRKKPDTTSYKIPKRTYQSSSPASSKRDHPKYDSWCSKGTKQRNKVDRAKTEVEEAAAALDDVKSETEGYRVYKGKSEKASRLNSAEKNLEKAKERLRDAEYALSDLEAEAHRKDIKPGWLRCQQ